MIHKQTGIICEWCCGEFPKSQMRQTHRHPLYGEIPICPTCKDEMSHTLLQKLDLTGQEDVISKIIDQSKSDNCENN